MRCHHQLWKMRSASSVHVRHASVEGELHNVVHVIPLVVRDDAVVRRTLVFIAFYRSLCFRRSHLS